MIHVSTAVNFRKKASIFIPLIRARRAAEVQQKRISYHANVTAFHVHVFFFRCRFSNWGFFAPAIVFVVDLISRLLQEVGKVQTK